MHIWRMPSVPTSAEHPVEPVPSAAARAELRRLGDEVDRRRAEYEARHREYEQLRTDPCALCEQPIPLWLFSKRSRARRKANKALCDARDAERKYRKAYFARSRPVDARDGEGAEPIAALRVTATPTPPDWKDPRHLLGDLLRAFGWKPEDMPPPVPMPPRARAGQPTDRAERDRVYKKELEEADPLLRELVKRAEALRSWPLHKPSDYEREWQAIVEKWNEAIRERRWFQMTPLCEICGTALFRRPLWYGRGERGMAKLSFTCKEECRNTKRQREHRLREKLRSALSDG